MAKYVQRFFSGEFSLIIKQLHNVHSLAKISKRAGKRQPEKLPNKNQHKNQYRQPNKKPKPISGS